jgi:hypothetical protein
MFVHYVKLFSEIFIHSLSEVLSNMLYTNVLNEIIAYMTLHYIAATAFMARVNGMDIKNNTKNSIKY